MVITVGVTTSIAPNAITTITATTGVIGVTVVITAMAMAITTATGVAEAHCLPAATPCMYTNGPEGPFLYGARRIIIRSERRLQRQEC